MSAAIVSPASSPIVSPELLERALSDLRELAIDFPDVGDDRNPDAKVYAGARVRDWRVLRELLPTLVDVATRVTAAEARAARLQTAFDTLHDDLAERVAELQRNA